MSSLSKVISTLDWVYYVYILVLVNIFLLCVVLIEKWLINAKFCSAKITFLPMVIDFILLLLKLFISRKV